MVEAILKAKPLDPGSPHYCGNEIKDPVEEGATWPDDIRGERKNGNWHYIDIPRGAKRGPIDQYCGKSGCVTQAIAEQTAILKDKNASPEKRADAVRYIIHFVGDLHQPLHAATNDDEGGNCVPLNYLQRIAHERNRAYSPNLHAVWDTAILEVDMQGADPGEFAETLAQKFAADVAGWQQAGIHVDDWAWESHDAAESAVYGELTPKIPVESSVPVHSCMDDNNIGQRLLSLHITAAQPYQQKSSPVVERRIAQAGVRLAMILNDAAKAAQ
jgi:hypothetical protein